MYLIRAYRLLKVKLFVLGFSFLSFEISLLNMLNEDKINCNYHVMY